MAKLKLSYQKEKQMQIKYTHKFQIRIGAIVDYITIEVLCKFKKANKQHILYAI
ncbi:hypothetical protein [Campylobacter portucalensis]|uniref:hypothetical protein n=1 Tax=Campylobacter portucalensis TaxID=2608384 RepID=UPI001E2E3C5E|nr:hypothetical protein [Campylobacter portucalensis]